MPLKEALQDVPVRLQAVSPEIVAYQRPRRPELLLDKRQRDFGRGGVAKLCQRHGLRPLKRLRHRARQPRVLVRQRPPDAQSVHDGKQPRLAIPGSTRGLRIGEQVADVRVAAIKAGWRAGPDHGIELPTRQQAGDGFIRPCVLHANIGRQVQADFLDTPGLFIAAANPGHVRRANAVLLFQDHADPDVGGELILRQPDTLALQIRRRLNAVGADIDRGVAEGARRKYRHGDIGAVPGRRFHGVAAHRQFADVEVAVAKGAEENLLRIEQHVLRIDTVDLDGAVHQRTHPVVVADRYGELKLRHGLLSCSDGRGGAEALGQKARDI